jgi:hypothetical protein
MKLKNILNNASSLSWKDSLFLSDDENWSLDSLCYLFDLDDLDEDEEIPKYAFDNNLMYVLGISDIQDIVDNAKQQVSQCSDSDLFKAFLYYYKNDAFISFSK